jgi:hypothetical protein
VVAAANWGIEREEGNTRKGFESVLDELRGFLAIGIDISVASSVAVRPLDQRSPAGDPRDRTSGAPRSPTAVYLLSWEREKKEGEKRGRERRERGVLARSAPCLLMLRGAWGVRVLEGVGGVEPVALFLQLLRGGCTPGFHKTAIPPFSSSLNSLVSTISRVCE